MDTNGYSLSDIAAVANENGFGGNNGLIYILLFAMIFGGNGFGFGNRGDGYAQYATAASQQDILFGQKFSDLDNKIDRLGNGIADATFALNNSIKDGNSAVAGAVVTEGRNLASQLAECCCTTNRNIDSVNYNAAMNTAAINANTTAQTQKVLDALCTNRMADMQNQINELQLKSAMCGVVRYPNAWTYNAGTSPFCNCNTGCGCGNTNGNI